MRAFGWTVAIILSVVLMVAIGTCNRITKGTGELIEKEFNVKALLKKYEYFKDCSSQLDKKMADLQIYEKRLDDLKSQYSGVKRKDWARDDREQYSIWESEASGIAASYNSLAAEYNAAMAKFNYSFCNVGQLPQGADMPLPREYKPYLTK